MPAQVKKALQKGLVKPSVGRRVVVLSRAQNSCLWRHNVKSKVRTVFIAGIFSEIIKYRHFICIKLYLFENYLYILECSLTGFWKLLSGQRDLGQLIFFVAHYVRFQLLTRCKAPTVSQVINSPLPPPLQCWNNFLPVGECIDFKILQHWKGERGEDSCCTI